MSDKGLILRSGHSRGDVKVHGEMWWFKSRCEGSWKDVVAPVEVRRVHGETWWLKWRLRGSFGDAEAHEED